MPHELWSFYSVFWEQVLSGLVLFFLWSQVVGSHTCDNQYSDAYQRGPSTDLWSTLFLQSPSRFCAVNPSHVASLNTHLCLLNSRKLRCLVFPSQHYGLESFSRQKAGTIIGITSTCPISQGSLSLVASCSVSNLRAIVVRILFFFSSFSYL